MLTAFMKVVLPVFFLSSISAQNPDQFVGTWTMDIPRSESAHQTIPIESSTIVIGKTDGGIKIETTRQDQGARRFHEVLNVKLDGSETTNAGDSGVSVRAHARWDGAKLVIETSRELQGSTITTREVHSISPNGSEMTVEKTLTVQHGYQGTGQAIAPTTGHGSDIFVRTKEQSRKFLR